MDSLERRARSALRQMMELPSSSDHQQQQLLLPLAAGVVTFGATCAVSCASQLALGLSAGSAPFCTTVTGMCTVAAASLASHASATAAQTYQRTGRLPNYFPLLDGGVRAANHHPSTLSSFPQSNHVAHHHHSAASDEQWAAQHHRLRVCLLGCIAFQLLGGRFWALAPSRWTAPGSFARASLPATERYATAAQRELLQRLGATWGCHTCGSRRLLLLQPRSSAVVRFVGDHMPPKSVAAQMDRVWYRKWLGRTTKFRFYPQCVPCSNKQGSLLSAATRRVGKTKHAASLAHVGDAYFHGWRPRVFHLTGGVVAAAAVHEPVHRGVHRLERWTRRQWRSLERKFGSPTLPKW